MTRYKWPAADCEPVRWFELISAVNRLNAATTWGMAGIWGLIQHGEYEQASARVEEFRQAVLDGELGEQSREQLIAFENAVFPAERWLSDRRGSSQGVVRE